MNVLVPNVLTPTLYLGFLYLCALPATVQSAIAYTSVAGGNVAAAICSASASSILGVFLSPILVGMLMQTQGGDTDTLHAIGSIIMQLMVPFVVGHLSRPLIAKWVERHKNWSISLTGHLFVGGLCGVQRSGRSRDLESNRRLVTFGHISLFNGITNGGIGG